MKSIQFLFIIQVICFVIHISSKIIFYPCDNENNRHNDISMIICTADRNNKTTWAERHTNITNIVMKKRKEDIQILFIGDSITEKWETIGRDVWDQYYVHRHALNLGFSGDRIQNVLWRLQNGEIEKNFQPKAIILMIGTNNIKINNALEITKGIISTTRYLHEQMPCTKIILLGIFPRGLPDSEERRKTIKVNEILSGLVPFIREPDQWIDYHDIGSVLVEHDCFISKDIMKDGLHPTKKGYQLWAEAMESFFVFFKYDVKNNNKTNCLN